MCGIAGFAGYSPGASPDLREQIERMTRPLAHRGPDDSGLWIDADVPVAFGHRRLSILDLSPEGHQPMLSPSGRYVLTYNGEIYNFREIRQTLAGTSFRGGSDTEVMLAAFERLGIEGALERFNGMFAFGLWDRERRVLHLACDRFGEKPLYYALIGGRLIFGSELKALRAHPGFPSDIDRLGLAYFLNHGYVPAPHSIFQGVRKLEPGTWLTWHPERDANGLPAPRQYWSARDTALRAASNPWRGSDEDATDRLQELLEQSIRLRMVSDVPLGAFLSGGIDSTAVVALMQKNSTRQVRTFTIGMDDSEYNEAVHAKAVARHLGTEHNELYISPADAMGVIPKLSSMYDEPFADSSQIPTFLVSQFARSQVTVSLSGDAGDELFGGYTRYMWGESIWRRIRVLPASLRSVAARTLSSVSASRWDSLMRIAGPAVPPRFRQTKTGDKIHKLAAVLECGDRERLYYNLISFWPDAASVALHSAPLTIPVPGFEPPGGRFTDWMMFMDTSMYLPGDILCKVDRAAMAVSLETRVPILDPALFEFAWSLPPELRVRNGEGKWLLRQMVYRHVPREMMERPKSGFGIPLHDWLRGPLRDWAESLLDPASLKLDGLIDPEPVSRRWRDHLSGARNLAPSLWCVLMFQSWLHRQTESDTAPALAGCAA